MKSNPSERKKCRMEACQDQPYVPPPACGSSEIPKEIREAELSAIRKRRKTVLCQSAKSESTDANSGQDKAKKIKDNLVGLALSGGGIRSATFSLGIMQNLAKAGWLKHVDYLSTVSGGGYIGGSLTWLLSDNARKLRKNCCHWNVSDNFPYGVQDPRHKRRRKDEIDILTHLRRHGKYLIPGDGITTTSLIAVILRGILLNLVVWLPATICFMVELLLVSSGNWYAIWDIKAVYLVAVLLLVLFANWDVRNFLKSVCSNFSGQTRRSEPRSVVKSGVIIGLSAWVSWLSRDGVWRNVNDGYAFLRTLVQPWSDFGRVVRELCLPCNGWDPVCWIFNEVKFDWLLYIAVLTGIVFLLFSILYSLFTRRPILEKPEIPSILKDSYWRRRRFEEWIRLTLWIGVPLLILYSIPMVSGWLKNPRANGIGGITTLLLGYVGGFWVFVRSARSGRIPVSILAPLASILFFYALALVSYDLASLYLCTDWFKWLHLGGLFISVLSGIVVNLNYISIHRYYRDRLMEAFMPHPNMDGRTSAAIEADKAELSKMCSKHAPYHLVNTNVVLVDSRNPRLKNRGGDAFLLSPMYCGSAATGWIGTANYMKKDSLTLPTAVAISGAAANPNTAASGSGPTRKPLLSLLMSLLNVRLGYWVPHPCPSKHKHRRVATHFRAAYHELSPRGYAEHQNLLQISDGGHFENLGVYELVRRRVKLIICCDGSRDPEFRFKDLQVLVRRIGTDFGARIEFDCDNRLERLIPRDPDPQKVIDRDPWTEAYPVGVKFADRGYVKGTIFYPNSESCTCTDRGSCNCADRDENKGVFILIKSTMIKKLEISLKGYKGANPHFPDESTTDQFFDEEQFEAYRELGYEIARRMTCDLNLEELLK